jgi:hypothetical protein
MWEPHGAEPVGDTCEDVLALQRRRWREVSDAEKATLCLLGDAFYCNPESLRRAVTHPLDASLPARRRPVRLADSPDILCAHTPASR